MNLVLYGILVILALFIILLVFNPNISCFGKRIKSPFYPVMRKRNRKKTKTTDYGFDLGEGEKQAQEKVLDAKRTTATQDYGFDLGAGEARQPLRKKSYPRQGLRAEDYGFDLGGADHKKSQEEKPAAKESDQ